MLRIAIAFGLICSSLGQITGGEIPVIKELSPNVLSPPYFNIATGKKIATTATCGSEGEERFCKLTGGTNFEYSVSLHQGQVCDVCNANVPEKSHPVKNAIDGTEKWWQSPPLSRGSQYNRVNVTIHLGQVFHVAYVLIKFANSPRAGTWVLERSSDYGETFQPWQYFANTDSDCYHLFGMGSLEEITRDDSVICTSDYSSVVPLENGEVIVSMIKGRPGAQNFSYATVLQEWSKATNVRLRFMRAKTLLGHLMAISEQDDTVTRRYYYSVKDISIGGRCVCNGHADTCSPDEEDQYKLKCECRHNTCGDSCEYCCPGFVQKAWRAAVPESTNECEACNCHGHSSECEYDEEVALRRLSLDLDGNYEGGGVCQNCLHNTAGINCEQCASGYWRPIDVDPTDPYGCRPCECDSAYTVGSCEPNTGRCYCKVQYAGDRCDRCAPGYYDFPECRPCDCYYNGTLNDVCLPVGDACPCKYNFAGKYCDECAAGFFNFPVCEVCMCDGEGVASPICDPYSGACPCSEGFTGPTCSECAPGYFSYPLCQRCPCSDVGTTDEVCDPQTGQCFCDDKYTGRSCDDCKSGFYGFPLCEACHCTNPGSYGNVCDTRSGRCTCKPNYQGERCDDCAPEYYGYPNCVACDCDITGSQRTTCDQTTGQCLCQDNIRGRACDMCTPDYFNFPRCEECSCDVRGIVSFVPGVCLAFTTGQCECKENVIGKNCDMCKPLHYDLDQGCVGCTCFVQGTLDGVGECDSEDGQCWCKPYTCTQRCSQCVSGFYALEELNYLGCTSCQCDVGGAMTSECDKNSGQCDCKNGIGGRRCNRALDGFYYPTLYQHQYELEDGHTLDNGIVRAGFDYTEFPGFSMNGYAQYSVVQRTVLIPVVVRNDGLYRLLFRYINTGSSAKANVTIAPSQDTAGTKQSYTVMFDVTSTPRMITVPTPFVLDRGTWTISLEAAPGLLVDYLVLLPSEYYEPGILELTMTVPCVPTLEESEEECVMYTHPSLEAFTTGDLTAGASSAKLNAPSTAHPEMVVVDGSNNHVTTEINVPSSGKYVLVLEYASNDNRFQKARVSVTDSAGSTYEDRKFNIYSCPYSFLCRQVALGVLNDVAVFDMALSTMRVNIQADSGISFYVKSLTAIPFADWTMELVEPKPRCITTQGPEFDECITATYKVPVGASRSNAPQSDPNDVNGGGSEVKRRPNTITNNDTPLFYLDGTDADGEGRISLQIPMNLDPGRYVFLVHYYNPEHTGFSPRVVIDSGIASTGTANITYCPHGDGCRAVVTLDDGRIVVDITVPTTLFTITVPEDKAFWIQYILAVPEADYDPTLLDLEPIDKSSDFIEDCSTDGQQSFYNTLSNPSELCQNDVFSLTVNYNNGGLDCDCSGAGTIGGGDVVCEEYGGQCPCKPNVIGRQCDRCMTGFYGYPDCRACDCNGGLCDEVTGECICPPNTVKPDCNTCVPFSHSFHPLLGCEKCDCNVDGVVNVADTACNPSDGQCNCKEHVVGQMCDRCETGYFGFPECKQCTCDGRGSISDKCDPVTGQCRCKENVVGLQCDRCKQGAFHLDVNKPKGCSICFCFGVSNQCHSSGYPATEIYDLEKWRMLFLVNPKPEVISTNNGRTIQVNVDDNGGPLNPSRPALYWAAPKTYLGDKIGSYGGELRYVASWSVLGTGRGDNSDNHFGQPALLLGSSPDLILKGNDMVIGWVNDAPSESVRLELSERNFQHQDSGNDVTRQELMMVLADLQSLHIRAAPETGVTSLTLQDVVMTTTDYSLPIGSAESISAVEECTCPPGYHGHSCQYCDDGHYRSDVGPYLGYCEKCDCFPHCLRCDDNGELIAGDICLHNTGGDNCGVCTDGYIGNATSGEINACKPCPCPFPIEGGNFAETCEEIDDEIVCHCQEGYTGQRCELCATGYFGNPSIYGGSCQPCNCHGNVDPNSVFSTCDSLTGECSDCSFNTGGKYCERCADGFYGDAIIARNCTECSCSACGTAVCDDVMGHCSCLPNVIGKGCDTCEPGFWDYQSCSGCRSCGCTEGALGEECDITTGQCQCAPNIVGLRCDKCAPGFWNYSPQGCLPCNCRNNGKCNPANGKCECPPGITGDQCDECVIPRQILELGATECSQCDSCTDDLLDEIEPMTADVKDAYRDLSNISVGLLAVKRLQDIQDRVDNVRGELAADEGFMTSSSTQFHKLLNGASEDFDVSGSGENEEETSEILAPSFKELEMRIAQTEANVSEMCNHTEELLEQVTITENRTSDGVINSDSLMASSTRFELEARDLLDKLTEEASGDSDDYFEKLMSAEMILEKMRERNFTSMMIAADDETTLADELFARVEENFIEPSTNMSNRVNTITDDLNETHAKLRDLRAQLNDATSTVNDVNTANSVNQKNLTTMSGIISNINADATMAEDILIDAEQLLEAAMSSVNGPITDEIAALEELGVAVRESYNDLLPYYDSYFDGMDQYESLVNQSNEKVAMLIADADALDAIVKNDSQAPMAANRYQSIINAMNEAKDAAEMALMEARKAERIVADKDLQSDAEAALFRSDTILSSTQDLQRNRMNKLIEDMENANNNLNQSNETKISLRQMLNDIKDDIAALDTGDSADDLEATRSASAKALELADNADRQATELEEALKRAPDPNLQLNRQLAQVKVLLDNMPNAIQTMEDKATAVEEKSERINRLRRNYQMPNKIDDIQKKIALSRSLANTVKSTMHFTPVNDGPSEYVEVRVPFMVQDTDSSIRMEFSVKVDADSPDNHLMYVGDAANADDDFASLETVGGKVRYHYKVGNGIGRLDSVVDINDGGWHTIIIERQGNKGMLLVEYPDPNPPRGDSAGSGNMIQDIQRGQTNSDDMIATMATNNMNFYLGGNPSETRPPMVQNSRINNVCMGGVTFNNESIGMWNFKAYNGPKPGNNCPRRSANIRFNQVWRFRGGGSYVRVGRADVTFNKIKATAHVIGFTLQTLQDNSLIFLVGETLEQFMALEVVDGKFWMTWNFGFENGPMNASCSVSDHKDITQESNPILVKAGFAPDHYTMVVAVKLRLKIQEKYPESQPNLAGDIWVGGLWPSNINPEFRSVLKNVDISYRGCLRDLSFNGKSFNIQNAKERIGVTRGCQKESVQTVKFQGSEYIRKMSALPNAEDVEGGIVVSTTTPAGTVISTADSEDTLESDVIQPNIRNPNDNSSAGLDEGARDEDGDSEPPPAADVPMAGNDEMPASDTAVVDTNTSDETTVSDALPVRPIINRGEQARYGAPPKEDINEGDNPASSGGSFLPVVLIVIGVIVGIVLFAAVVSALLKSSLVAGSGAGARPQPSPEQAPLNDVQAQRTAQMAW